MRKLLHVQVDALTVVDFTMLYVVTRRLFLSSRDSSLVINLLTIFELTVINNDKGRNSIAALEQSVPPVDWTSLQRITARGNISVTFHDDHSVKTKTTRQYLDVYVIEFETISEPSRKAQETFRRETQS